MFLFPPWSIMGNMKILVVDDEQAVRESLRRSLIFNGYDVSLAEDGVEAVESIGRDRPDLVILDIKAVDPELHRRLTGQDNALILQFADKLREINKPVWLRHVLIPGLTDSEEELLAFRRIALSMPNAQRVELLPYHTLGKFKWAEMGLEYPLEGVPEPTKEDMARAHSILNLPEKA
mgnify:CR=1 FL=1